MLAPSSGLLGAGIELKLNQIKLATKSYLRDRTSQATGTVTSYVIAAGLFAAAGIFLIAALFVGTFALFRWVEINHGQFWAFGAVGGLLVVIASISAGLAAIKLKRPAPHFPSLISRLRVAIKSNPAQPDQIEAVRDTAEAILQSPAVAARPADRRRRLRPGRNGSVQAGLIVTATLLGLALARRRQQARKAAI